MAVAQIKSSHGRALTSNPGFVLRTDAAAAWDRAVEKFGKNVLITGAWRSYETQVKLFKERYRAGARSPYGDYRYWNGTRYGRVKGAAAAVPGTSNHGGGVAVDVKTARSAGDPGRARAVVFTSWEDRDRQRFLKIAAGCGWDDDEGRRVKELWHLTYYPDRDKARGSGTGGGTRRKPHRIGTIRQGSTGWRVGLLQHRLRGVGAYRGKVDKKFGPKTADGVRTFQRKRRQLTVDGVVGPQTWYHLGRGAKRGRGGRWRNEIAQRVVGLQGEKVDGVIGAQTVERIREVQRWLGIPDDGVYGKATARALVRKG